VYGAHSQVRAGTGNSSSQNQPFNPTPSYSQQWGEHAPPECMAPASMQLYFHTSPAELWWNLALKFKVFFKMLIIDV